MIAKVDVRTKAKVLACRDQQDDGPFRYDWHFYDGEVCKFCLTFSQHMELHGRKYMAVVRRGGTYVYFAGCVDG